MDVVYGSVPIQRLVALLESLRTRFHTSYDRARTLLFCYVVLRYAIKSVRHLRARGTLETFQEGWNRLSEVRSSSFRVLCYSDQYRGIL